MPRETISARLGREIIGLLEARRAEGVEILSYFDLREAIGGFARQRHNVVPSLVPGQPDTAYGRGRQFESTEELRRFATQLTRAVVKLEQLGQVRRVDCVQDGHVRLGITLIDNEDYDTRCRV